MSDIFISYANQDADKARAFAEALSQKGWSVWWDRKIPAGSSFEEVIEKELSNAGCVLVLWSEQSVQSHWVREEANEALNRGILVPVLIEETKIPLGFRTIEAADLTGWDGSAAHTELRILADGIEAILNRDGTNDKPNQKQERSIFDQPSATKERYGSAMASFNYVDIQTYENRQLQSRMKWGDLSIHIKYLRYFGTVCSNTGISKDEKIFYIDYADIRSIRLTKEHTWPIAMTIDFCHNGKSEILYFQRLNSIFNFWDEKTLKTRNMYYKFYSLARAHVLDLDPALFSNDIK